MLRSHTAVIQSQITTIDDFIDSNAVLATLGPECCS